MISRILLTFSIALFAGSTCITQAVAQQRDHLTLQEVDLVKEAQALDKRIDVFVKAAERRLMVINGAATANTNTKQLKKDSEKGWGELPTGSRAELITNIDDVSTRDERNPLIAKSLRKLAQSVNTIMAQLKPLASEAKSEAEIASFELLNEDAQSITEAANKLPPEVVPDKKAKKSN